MSATGDGRAEPAPMMLGTMPPDSIAVSQDAGIIVGCADERMLLRLPGGGPEGVIRAEPEIRSNRRGFAVIAEAPATCTGALAVAGDRGPDPASRVRERHERCRPRRAFRRRQDAVGPDDRPAGAGLDGRKAWPCASAAVPALPGCVGPQDGRDHAFGCLVPDRCRPRGPRSLPSRPRRNGCDLSVRLCRDGYASGGLGPCAEGHGA